MSRSFLFGAGALRQFGELVDFLLERLLLVLFAPRSTLISPRHCHRKRHVDMVHAVMSVTFR